MDVLLASVFWAAAIFCWVLLWTNWRIDRQASLWAALGPALFATVVGVFLTVRLVLS